MHARSTQVLRLSGTSKSGIGELRQGGSDYGKGVADALVKFADGHPAVAEPDVRRHAGQRGALT